MGIFISRFSHSSSVEKEQFKSPNSNRKYNLFFFYYYIYSLLILLYFVEYIAITGPACIGKTTFIQKSSGSILPKLNRKVTGKLLDYNELCKVFPCLKKKTDDIQMEVAYGILHTIRTFFDDELSYYNGEVFLVDRTIMDHLIYDVLFFLNGHTGVDVQRVLDDYDTNPQELQQSIVKKIESFDKVVKLLGDEMARMGNYQIVIAFPCDIIHVANNLKLRSNFDAQFNTINYTVSQTALFFRFANLLPKQIVTIMPVKKGSFFNLSLVDIEDIIFMNENRELF